MTAKPSKPAAKNARAPVPANGYKTSSIDVVVGPGSTDADFAVAVARTLTRPETSAASVIETWQKDTHDVNALAAELSRQVEAVNRGDLRRAEGLLLAQAHTLDNIFAILARRATGQQYLPQWEAYMRMGMRAQNQCRMTLETLATIKNPPAVFARQANINNGGQQQVNNGSAVPRQGGSRVGETPSEQNKLLEAKDVERLDTGAQGSTGRTDQDPAPVGTGDRPAKRSGQGGSCT
jgi:hypothetical protein